jgi:hypothetical protein
MSKPVAPAKPSNGAVAAPGTEKVELAEYVLAGITKDGKFFHQIHGCSPFNARRLTAALDTVCATLSFPDFAAQIKETQQSVLKAEK